MRRLPALVVACVAPFAVACAPDERPESTEEGPDVVPHVVASSAIEAGRYLVIQGGCNDCHTEGYMERSVPEEEWLTGSPVGFRGPWGTSYPANLRLRVQQLSADEWAAMLQTRKALPPHPWVNTNLIADSDARALYEYIGSLGPAGESMPAAVPPEQEPITPYISLIPIEPTAE